MVVDILTAVAIFALALAIWRKGAIKFEIKVDLHDKSIPAAVIDEVRNLQQDFDEVTAEEKKFYEEQRSLVGVMNNILAGNFDDLKGE